MNAGDRHREVERAFLLDGTPSHDPDRPDDAVEIVQHYVALDAASSADDDAVQLRVRKAGDRHTLTVKGGSGGDRVEVEIDIDADRFAALAALDRGRCLRKRRLAIELGDGLVAEIDHFDGELAGLALVEVEFESAHAAGRFTPPDWFGREVTGRAGWSNAELAVDGVPDDLAL